MPSSFENFAVGMNALRQGFGDIREARNDKARQDYIASEVNSQKNKLRQDQVQQDFSKNLGNNPEYINSLPSEMRDPAQKYLQQGGPIKMVSDLLDIKYKGVPDDIKKAAGYEAAKFMPLLNSDNPQDRAAAMKGLSNIYAGLQGWYDIQKSTQGMTASERSMLRNTFEADLRTGTKEVQADAHDYLDILQNHKIGKYWGDQYKPGAYEEIVQRAVGKGYSKEQADFLGKALIQKMPSGGVEKNSDLLMAFGNGGMISIPPRVTAGEASQARQDFLSNPESGSQSYFNIESKKGQEAKDFATFAGKKLTVFQDKNVQKQIETEMGKRFKDISDQELNNYVQNKLMGGSEAQQPQPQAKATSPKVGEEKNGYRFKGGDPSKAASWEKVK